MHSLNPFPAPSTSSMIFILMSFHVKKAGEIKNRLKKSWFLESELLTITSEAFSEICFNATSFSIFEQISVDPLFNLNICFVWVKAWNSADEFYFKQRCSLFSLGSSDICCWYHVSEFHQYNLWQKNQRPVSITFSEHLICINEKNWEGNSEISRKPLFGLSLLKTAEKFAAYNEIFSKFLFSALRADW